MIRIVIIKANVVMDNVSVILVGKKLIVQVDKKDTGDKAKDLLKLGQISTLMF